MHPGATPEAKVPANQLLKCILLVSSRLIFHPLGDYPGPLFARLTDAYGGYFALKKRLHLVTYRNFQDYGETPKLRLELSLTTLRWITGPVVRQAPNRLVFNTVTALHGKRPEN